VARDRQRAKQRRKPGAGGPVPGAAPATGRDIGLEPADTELDGTDTPGVDEMPDVDRAPDSLETDRDLASASSVRREAARDPHHRRADRGRFITFLGHVVDELRRVQWPDRRQVGQGTLVTLLFVLVAGGYLGLLDAIWKPIMEAIL
jgi:preprotein translocase SecE subunit